MATINLFCIYHIVCHRYLEHNALIGLLCYKNIYVNVDLVKLLMQFDESFLNSQHKQIETL